MKVILALILFTNITYSIEIDGIEYTESRIQEIRKGLDQWNEIAENSSHLPPEKAIPLLGKGLYKTSLPSIYVVGDRLGVRAKLQRALLNIPGHAEYYGNEIRRLTEIEIAGSEARERVWAYETLAELPSAETVKVLGELVFDDRDPWKSWPPSDGGKPLPNTTRSVLALNRLGIKNAPSKNIAFDEADIHTWQLWFEQVKAGTRTFSFEGDDRVYSLASATRQTRPPPSRGNDSPEEVDLTPRAKRGLTPLEWLIPGAATILVCIIIFRLAGWSRRKSDRQP